MRMKELKNSMMLYHMKKFLKWMLWSLEKKLKEKKNSINQNQLETFIT
jgi:hypothetical protein